MELSGFYTMEIPPYMMGVFRSFTSSERQSAYQLLCGAMMCNGRQNAAQIQAINEICTAMNVSDFDRERSRSLSQSVMENTLRSLSDEKKFIIARGISTIALADGNVSQQENAYAMLWSEKLNINPEFF